MTTYYRPPTDASPFPADPNFQAPASSNVTLFIIAALVSCAITIFAVLIVVLVRPENKEVVITIVSIMTPITMGLLGAGIYGVQKGVNGRFSQLLSATAYGAERAGRAQVIKQLYYQLQSLDPQSPEFQEMAKQIQAESIRHFEAVEQRGPGAAGPVGPPSIPTSEKVPPATSPVV